MNSYAKPEKNTPAAFLRNYRSARANLLLMAILTAVNCIFVFLRGSIYLPFCSLIPYMLISDGIYMTGNMPEEYYADWSEYYGDMPFFDISYLIIMTVVAAVIILLFVACFFLSGKERRLGLIVALVLYSIDALYVLYHTVIYLDPSMLIDVAFHAWVIVYLALGISGLTKLKRLEASCAV